MQYKTDGGLGGTGGTGPGGVFAGDGSDSESYLRIK